ncbi:MAG: tRNA (adenosine(37)-N6)-dimethylallyltransferase MiaA [Candidatus Methylomirabilia bacterium]
MGRTLEPLVVITGPTGIGKTETAIHLARRIPLEVVSADSRQVYRRMEIGTGKPNPAQRAQVPHHLLDLVDPDERYHAARFRREALTAIREIRERGRLPVVVGGTGLYIRALLRGLSPAPPGHPEFRGELSRWARGRSPNALHQVLLKVDPEAARRIHPKDMMRIIRAIEVRRYREAPQVLGGSHSGHDGEGGAGDWAMNRPPFRLLMVGLTRPRAALATTLNFRVEAMVAQGLQDEVRGLLQAGYDESLSAMKGIGYRHFCWMLRGRISEAEAVRLMKRDTIRYAKRQWTWFKREPDLQWMDLKAPCDLERAAQAIAKLIERHGLLRGGRIPA